MKAFRNIHFEKIGPILKKNVHRSVIGEVIEVFF